MNLPSIGFLLFVAAIMLGCSKEPSPEQLLAGAIRQIEGSRAVHYEYKATWDNRFNETAYLDSARVIYSRPDSSRHGFAFFVSTRGNEYLFDGFNYKEYRHGEKTIVRHEAKEIKADPDYFSGKMFFAYTPFELTKEKAFDSVLGATIDGTDFFIYRETNEKPSAGDTTKTVRTERSYYLERASSAVQRIRQATIIGEDTLQVIDCRFSNIRFERLPPDLSGFERPAALQYREVSIRDIEAELTRRQIAPGDTLERRSYADISGKDVALFGNPERQAVVLFSFIGCGGCEYALRELKKNGYRIRKGLNFYYSSPVDKEKVLRPYLDKKEFPFIAFSKESGMNEDFSIYAFPTFVLIGADGVVRKVVSGFGTEAREMLLEPDAN